MNALTPHIQPHTSKPLAQQMAKRMINTKSLSNEEWLNVRRQGIGSSDAATACGLNPYMSMLELWLIKTGRSTVEDHSLSEDYDPLYWGKQLEPLVAKFYQQKTGYKVRRVNAVLQHPDPDLHFMLANLDYAVVGSDEVQVLECKTTGEHGAKLWRDGVPLYVLCQVQHQLAVTGKQAAHVCVLLCGHETRIFKVTRSESVIQHLIEAERQFWSYVENDIPPPPDASVSAAKALQQLYPQHLPLQTIDLSTEPHANALFDQLLQLKQEIEEKQQQYDQHKHELQALIKDAEKAVFKQGSIVWKKSKDSVVLDVKALLRVWPKMLQAYPLHKQGSRRFNIYTHSDS